MSKSKNNVADFTEYAARDGTVYTFDTEDRFILSEEGAGLPPIEYITQQGPFQHGQTLIDYRLQPRIIQLTMRQNSCDRFTYWVNRAALIDGIRPNRHSANNFGTAILRRRFPDGSMKNLNVIIQEGPIFNARDVSRWDEWGYTEVLRFIAHDPVYYDPTPAQLKFTNIPPFLAELEFPTVFPMRLGGFDFADTKATTYLGNWISFPEIQITGPANSLQITNVTTGEVISMDYDIAVGEIVTISLEYGNKTVSNQAGLNLIGTITSTTDLVSFHIAPEPEAAGGVNSIKVESGGLTAASEVLITYYNKYLGY